MEDIGIVCKTEQKIIGDPDQNEEYMMKDFESQIVENTPGKDFQIYNGNHPQTFNNISDDEPIDLKNNSEEKLVCDNINEEDNEEEDEEEDDNDEDDDEENDEAYVKFLKSMFNDDESIAMSG
jgi:hypothetical protein